MEKSLRQWNVGNGQASKKKYNEVNNNKGVSESANMRERAFFRSYKKTRNIMNIMNIT